MNFLKRSTILTVLTLFLSIGLLFTIMGCEKTENTDDLIPMEYEQPPLGYAYDSLEPFVDATTMEIHYTKHHNSYTNNLNAAFEIHPELHTPLEQLLADPSLIPEDIRTAVLNNGGGYYNHALYFSILKINNGQIPSGDLAIAINENFGSFEEFEENFTNAASTQFGSGWAWLIVTDEGLEVVATSNQDTPLAEGTPVLCIDVWEHAYYLNYQNRRSDYISAFFNVINWDKVSELYDNAS